MDRVGQEKTREIPPSQYSSPSHSSLWSKLSIGWTDGFALGVRTVSDVEGGIFHRDSHECARGGADSGVECVREPVERTG